MKATRCDATYATDNDGREGFVSALVENEPDFVSVPVGACSSDRVEIWHGMSDPAIACGKHARYGRQSAFSGHRERLKRATQ